MKSRFDQYLVDYQEDLERIIQKYLSKDLGLSVGDVVGQANFYLIKTKDKFFEKFGYDFARSDFNKWAYAYARNVTRWQGSKAYGYTKNISDTTYQTEDGPVTLFEWVCNQIGIEDDGKLFDEGAKLKVIIDIVTKYSHILTKTEKETFVMMLEGKTEKEISDAQDVTRQAVNQAKIRVFEKLQNHYKGISVEDENISDITNANESAEYLAEMFDSVDKKRMNQRAFRVARKPEKINFNSNFYAPE